MALNETMNSRLHFSVIKHTSEACIDIILVLGFVLGFVRGFVLGLVLM